MMLGSDTVSGDNKNILTLLFPSIIFIKNTKFGIVKADNCYKLYNVDSGELSKEIPGQHMSRSGTDLWVVNNKGYQETYTTVVDLYTGDTKIIPGYAAYRRLGKYKTWNSYGIILIKYLNETRYFGQMSSVKFNEDGISLAIVDENNIVRNFTSSGCEKSAFESMNVHGKFRKGYCTAYGDCTYYTLLHTDNVLYEFDTYGLLRSRTLRNCDNEHFKRIKPESALDLEIKHGKIIGLRSCY